MEQFNEVQRCLHYAQTTGESPAAVLVISNLGYDALRICDSIEEMWPELSVDCFSKTRRDTRSGAGWVQAYVWRYLDQQQ